MEIALYHPSFGYYASADKRVGKEGDFYTSVSVGEAFGQIIAHRISRIWCLMGKPVDFHLIEIGANDARFCIDICSQLEKLNTPITYHIIEPLPKLQNIQIENLQEAGFPKVQHHRSLEELKDLKGIILSNELIDAFPVQIIKKTPEGWKEIVIESSGHQFTESLKNINTSELHAFSNALPGELPLNYRTEFRPGLSSFLEKCHNALEQGIMLSIDYGFPASHYYHPSRTEGTLQTYFKHKKDDKPYEAIGKKDLTAHVDFTHFADEAQEAGFAIHDFSPQDRYLTHHGKTWLQSLEENFSPAALPMIKQFQTLTHPGMMGRQFHVLELSKKLSLNEDPLTSKSEEVLEL